MTTKAWGISRTFPLSNDLYCPGKARNLAEAAKDLACQKQAVLDAVERGVVFLATGNSRLLFGKSFTGADGQQIPGIGLFDYTGEETGNVFISDVLAHPISRRKPHLMVLSTEPPIFMVMTGIRSFTVVKRAGDGEIAENPRGEFVPGLFGAWQLALFCKNPELNE